MYLRNYCRVVHTSVPVPLGDTLLNGKGRTVVITGSESWGESSLKRRSGLGQNLSVVEIIVRARLPRVRRSSSDAWKNVQIEFLQYLHLLNMYVPGRFWYRKVANLFQSPARFIQIVYFAPMRWNCGEEYGRQVVPWEESLMFKAIILINLISLVYYHYSLTCIVMQNRTKPWNRPNVPTWFKTPSNPSIFWVILQTKLLTGYFYTINIRSYLHVTLLVWFWE